MITALRAKLKNPPQHSVPVATLLLSISYFIFHWVGASESGRVGWMIFFLLIQNGVWVYLFLHRRKIKTPLLVICASVSFLAARTSFPLFDTDFYRYFWDGMHVFRGLDPYALAPASQHIPELEAIRAKINFPELVTIYPPVAELLFGFVAALSFGHLSVFLWILTGLGAVSFTSAYRYLLGASHSKEAWRITLLFLVHPLIVKEWFQSVHFDSFLAATTVMGLEASSTFFEAYWFAIGANLKFSSLLGLAAIRKKDIKSQLLTALVFAVTFIIPWLFFRESAYNLLATVKNFGTQFEMNSGAFRLIREALSLAITDPLIAGRTSRAVVALIWVTLVFQILWSKKTHNTSRWEEAFWIFFLLVVLSPVANPWYFTWSLPLVIFLPEKRQRPMLWAYAVLPLSYAVHQSPGALVPFQAFWDVEHLVIWACVFRALQPYYRKK